MITFVCGQHEQSVNSDAPVIVSDPRNDMALLVLTTEDVEERPVSSAGSALHTGKHDVFLLEKNGDWIRGRLYRDRSTRYN